MAVGNLRPTGRRATCGTCGDRLRSQSGPATRPTRRSLKLRWWSLHSHTPSGPSTIIQACALRDAHVSHHLHAGIGPSWPPMQRIFNVVVCRGYLGFTLRDARWTRANAGASHNRLSGVVLSACHLRSATWWHVRSTAGAPRCHGVYKLTWFVEQRWSRRCLGACAVSEATETVQRSGRAAAMTAPSESARTSAQLWAAVTDSAARVRAVASSRNDVEYVEPPSAPGTAGAQAATTGHGDAKAASRERGVSFAFPTFEQLWSGEAGTIPADGAVSTNAPADAELSGATPVGEDAAAGRGRTRVRPPPRPPAQLRHGSVRLLRFSESNERLPTTLFQPAPGQKPDRFSTAADETEKAAAAAAKAAAKAGEAAEAAADNGAHRRKPTYRQQRHRQHAAAAGATGEAGVDGEGYGTDEDGDSDGGGGHPPGRRHYVHASALRQPSAAMLRLADQFTVDPLPTCTFENGAVDIDPDLDLGGGPDVKDSAGAPGGGTGSGSGTDGGGGGGGVTTTAAPAAAESAAGATAGAGGIAADAPRRPHARQRHRQPVPPASAKAENAVRRMRDNTEQRQKQIDGLADKFAEARGFGNTRLKQSLDRRKYEQPRVHRRKFAAFEAVLGDGAAARAATAGRGSVHGAPVMASHSMALVRLQALKRDILAQLESHRLYMQVIEAATEGKVEITRDDKVFVSVVKRAVLKGIIMTPANFFVFLGQVNTEAKSETWPKSCEKPVQVLLAQLPVPVTGYHQWLRDNGLPAPKAHSLSQFRHLVKGKNAKRAAKAANARARAEAQRLEDMAHDAEMAVVAAQRSRGALQKDLTHSRLKISANAQYTFDTTVQIPENVWSHLFGSKGSKVASRARSDAVGKAMHDAKR